VVGTGDEQVNEQLMRKPNLVADIYIQVMKKAADDFVAQLP
jgi:hypothetical protein